MASFLVASSDPGLLAAARQAAARLDCHFEARSSVAEATQLASETTNGRTAACLLVDLCDASVCGDLSAARRALAGAPILGVAYHHDVGTAVLGMRRGATDVLERPVDVETIVERMRPLLEVALANRPERTRIEEFRLKLAELSANERAVLDGVLQGKPNKDIAAGLGVSLRSVELWRSRLMKRLGVESLAELVRLSILVQGAS